MTYTHPTVGTEPIYHTKHNQLEVVMSSKGDRWMILQNKTQTHQNLYHKCHKEYTSVFPVTYENSIGSWHTQTLVKPAWRCAACRKKPPEKILTAYVLLDWEEATGQVRDVRDIRK
jgi:hypothetical protein